MLTHIERGLIDRLLQQVCAKHGKDPFVIVAECRLSIRIYSAEDELLENMSSFSTFQPENFTIVIDSDRLDIFWDEIFPGCPLYLKYPYACWRELWRFWVYHRFATVQSILQDDWLRYIDIFVNRSGAEQNYFAHYMASRATGLLKSSTFQS